MPRSENRLAARRPSARDGGGPGGSPSTRTKARRALRDQDPGCLEPMVCKQRRVDAAREVAEILECVLDPLLHLAEQLALSGGICSREALRHARLDGERHQLLLRAVVQVAFEAPTLLVLGGDESLARRAQVPEQARVREEEGGLTGQVRHKRLLDVPAIGSLAR
jgi:hypothetical protein